MTELLQTLDNAAYGFPTRGAARRIKPVVLAVLHATGNAKNLGPHAAQNERNYANRKNSLGPSAHIYVGRSAEDDTVTAIQPAHAAWSNGDVNKPNTANKGVAKLRALVAKGYNANEGVYYEIEMVGQPLSDVAPVTNFQLEYVAERLVQASKATGLPISRDTVLGHFDINSVTRASCFAKPAEHERLLKKVIDRANAILKGTPTSAPNQPAPVPAPSPDPAIAELTTELAAEKASHAADLARVQQLSDRLNAAQKLAAQIVQG